MRAVLIFALSIFLVEATAGLASAQVQYAGDAAGFVPADRTVAQRGARQLSATVPDALRTRASRFSDAGWTVVWDLETHVPSRIYGPGRAFPGSVSDPDIALDAARAVLAEEIALLAPGSAPGDFVVIANVENRGLRIVTLAQHYRGVPVLDATVGFRFKADRLFVIASSAAPNVFVADFSTPLPSAAARAAKTWLDNDLGIDARVGAVLDPVIVPLADASGKTEYFGALPAQVNNASGTGEWTVYVGSGDRPIGRISTIQYAAGTVLYNAPERWPGADRVDYPAALADLVVDGAGQTTLANGGITFGGATASVQTGLTGDLVTIQNQGGNASTTLTVADAASGTWLGGAADELLDAQLAVFVHGNIAMQQAKLLAPGLAVLANPIPANVNGTFTECNAFAGRNNMNFFVASMPQPNLTCGNTGQLADVIYHEFGHYFHINTIDQTGVPFDSAFSEGLSDYYAASITDDSNMGVGFFRDERPLRPIDGPGGDIYWPQAFWDDVDTHFTGVVFAGAMWDLRAALKSELGEGPGDTLADQLFYGAVQRADGVDTTYIEVLAEDDDDGNLANGTPNQCAIDFAFGTHGFGPARNLLGDGLEPHLRDRFTISVAEATPASGCPAQPVDSMELTWRLRSAPETGGLLPMELASGTYAATIPTQAEGEVIEYQITVNYAGGNSRRLPLNFADPFYSFFNGETEEIYCTDFDETDPLEEKYLLNEGWRLNNFSHGAPAGGENNTDAPAAFSGTSVVGTVLSGDGAYPLAGGFSLVSPEIDVTGRSNVRLQYRRWLNVADGQFDSAAITVNGRPMYSNPSAEFLFAPLLSLDHEWKFHDIDVQALAESGSVQAVFELLVGQRQTNRPTIFGGWNIDDFCFVSFIPSVCGDGRASGNELCDDGAANSDDEADACRTDCMPAACGDGATDTGEECDDGNDIDDDDCSNVCVDLSSGGCGCRVGDKGDFGGVLLFLVALVFVWRRRRRTE